MLPFPSSPRLRTSVIFIALALLCLALADIEISSISPGQEMGRFLSAFLHPDTQIISLAATAILTTLAFALLSVSLAAVAGFGLALIFKYRVVRALAATLRSVHELFWALIFLQCFGLHPITGLLAIALPYSGTFAKVYAETLADTRNSAELAINPAVPGFIRLIYSRIPEAWPHMVSYTRYRFECGIRSSAILGFIGVPTLGYYLEASFSQGYYTEVASLLLLFFTLIASFNLWCRAKFVPIYLALAPWFLGSGFSLAVWRDNPIQWANIQRFLSEDIIPAPLRNAPVNEPYDWSLLADWFSRIASEQILPGLYNTLVLSQIALVLAGLLSLLLFPLASRLFMGFKSRAGGKLLLIVMRSCPEYLLAYILLQLLGPSMLPAILALALHNGSLIAHLLAHRSESLELRADSSHGMNRYSYEVIPRVYGPFLAILFYRGEVIVRETAILGILGIHTLGFFVDSAMQEIRFDTALVLILCAAGINLIIDSGSRRLRRKLQLSDRVS